MRPYEHRWGESATADYVWAQIAALAPSLAERRCFVIWQAFMDESEGRDGTFVLAGHIATVEAWAAFAKEWEEMLPYAGLPIERPAGFSPIDERAHPGNAERFHFHMTELATPERQSRLPPFFRIIERHVALSLSCRINVVEMKRAMARIYVPNLRIDYGDLAIPYILAWRVLMDRFHYSKDMVNKIIPDNSTIDFFFDERGEKKIIREAWDAYISTRGTTPRERFGNEPRFENDRKFLPLQAADLWAWWVRKWESEGVAADAIRDGEGYLGLKPSHPKMHITIDEDGLATEFRKIIREGIEPGRPVWDIKMSFRPAPSKARE